MSKLTVEQEKKLESLVDEFKCPFQEDDTCVMSGGIRNIIQQCADIMVSRELSSVIK
ncbi:MAG: hypothetical protein ACYC09_03340 [Bacteroidota bacterium]